MKRNGITLSRETSILDILQVKKRDSAKNTKKDKTQRLTESSEVTGVLTQDSQNFKCSACGAQFTSNMPIKDGMTFKCPICQAETNISSLTDNDDLVDTTDTEINDKETDNPSTIDSVIDELEGKQIILDKDLVADDQTTLKKGTKITIESVGHQEVKMRVPKISEAVYISKADLISLSNQRYFSVVNESTDIPVAKIVNKRDSIINSIKSRREQTQRRSTEMFFDDKAFEALVIDSTSRLVESKQIKRIPSIVVKEARRSGNNLNVVINHVSDGKLEESTAVIHGILDHINSPGTYYSKVTGLDKIGLKSTLSEVMITGEKQIIMKTLGESIGDLGFDDISDAFVRASTTLESDILKIAQMVDPEATASLTLENGDLRGTLVINFSNGSKIEVKLSLPTSSAAGSYDVLFFDDTNKRTDLPEGELNRPSDLIKGVKEIIANYFTGAEE